MPAHSTLTGADLHEPKGADTASASTVYVADGAGSGDWVKISTSELDTSSIKNTNRQFFAIHIPDLLTAYTTVLPVPLDSTLVSAVTCITGTFTGADATITLSRAGVSTIGTIVIDDSGSAEGVLDSLSAPVNNIFTAPSYLKISSDGAPSGGASDAMLLLEFTLN